MQKNCLIFQYETICIYTIYFVLNEQFVFYFFFNFVHFSINFNFYCYFGHFLFLDRFINKILSNNIIY